MVLFHVFTFELCLCVMVSGITPLYRWLSAIQGDGDE